MNSIGQNKNIYWEMFTKDKVAQNLPKQNVF